VAIAVTFSALHRRLNDARDSITLSPAQVDDLIAEACTDALRLDAERLAIERNINRLAIRADEPAAAHELRRVCLRHRTVTRELRELRDLLRRVRDTLPGASAI
jgi:tRNA C32,U32 (ribose-2'-O)-methylase TrmJ